MRRMKSGDYAILSVFENTDGDISVLNEDVEERIYSYSPLAFELDSIVDLERIEKIVAISLLENQNESLVYKTLEKLNPDKEGARDITESEREEIIAKLNSAEDISPPLVSLYAALLAVGEAWREKGVHAEHLGVIAAFAPPESELATEINVNTPMPVWLLKHDSLASIFAVLNGVYRASKWMITVYGLVRPRFTTAYDASEWFIMKLRERASHKQPDPKALLRLDAIDLFDQRPKEKYDTLMVYLHGLFSTDIGTFDGFRDTWQELRKKYRQRYGDCADKVFGRISVLGWPHDTLVPVNENADDLADLICDNFGKSDCNIIFVCHSRGGLVARATLQKLYRRPSYNWDQRIKGVATFGTPHHGAELALLPGRYEGAYLLLLSGTNRLIALDMLFVYKRHRGRIDGIDDLAPLNNPISQFLHRLERDERKHPPQNFVVVGGDVTLKTVNGTFIWQWIRRIALSSINKLTKSSNHDAVVTTKSSLPHWAKRLKPAKCTHFDYFDRNEDSTMSQVADQLACWLEIEQAIKICKEKEDQSGVIYEDDGYWIGDQFVFRR